jgi:hypothetical protein
LLEVLEDRCVPSTIMPTTFADVLGSGSLRDAVLQFNADTGTDDDTILLAAGTYSLTIQNVGAHHETAGLTGDLNLTQTSHHWIIQGVGPSTIIDASLLQDRVFQIVTPDTQVVFRDLVIQGGLAQDDGSNGALAGTTDALGGGVLNNGGNVTLDNVVVQNNVARGGDAASGSPAGHDARGGGFYSTGGALTLAGATIANNQAIGGRGGDAYLFGYGGDGGSASGGGLYATGGSLDISHSIIGSNRATGGRGGDGLSITSGWGIPGGIGGTGQGGGLFVSGSSLTIASSTITYNQGTATGVSDGYDGDGRGGGLYNGGTLTVNNSTLSGNTASGDSVYYGTFGGGIENSGTLTVSNSTLSGNTASGNWGYIGTFGGGIENSGTLTVSNSTLSGNTASGYYGSFGGGISNAGTLTVTDSTLAANTANRVGGGIYNSGTLPVTLTNVTLTANRAYIGGGGLYVLAPGSPVLHNTLIAVNFRGATGTTRDDVFGRLNPSGDYNLIGDGTGMTGLSYGVNGNLIGSASSPIDPLLGPLQNNGGPTLTHALLAGSPALNAGDPNELGVPDQRGVVRSGAVNIGAYQASASAFVVTAPGTVTSGTPFDVTVQAVDVFGQVAFGYRGTVTFRVTDPDPAVVLPADYTFSADNQGTHIFTGEFTLFTPGMWMLTTEDVANGLSQDVLVTVDT